MKNYTKIFIVIAIYFIFNAIYAQTTPYWFDEPCIYRNWMPISEAVSFDSKVRTSGVPTWGIWYTFTGNSEDFYREDIANHHNVGKFYVPHLTYGDINIEDTLFVSVDSIAARSLDGNLSTSFQRLATSINSPAWKQMLKDYLKAVVDLGADGVFFDGMRPGPELSFDQYSLAAFRSYLSDNYSSSELQTQFDIQDIDSFDYIEWIESHNQTNNWENLPYEGLKEEFWKFHKLADRALFSELIQYVKDYALANGQIDFTVSCNIFFDAMSEFDTYFDLVDYSVGELHLFGKTYQRTRSSTEYSTSYEVYDFTAITNKVRRSMKDWPTIPLVELEGYGVLGYPDETENLIKLIFADGLASQGSVLLGSKLDGFLNDQLVFDVVDYNYDTAGQYANFVFSNRDLFTHLNFSPECGLLYSMSSLNVKNRNETNGLCITSFYGTGEFLIDMSIPFDVIFAPDTRFSTLPDISEAQLGTYKTIILPNTVNLNDHQVQSILNYMNNGGFVIALGDIGINDEDGKAASRFELENLQSSNGVKDYGSGKFIYFREQRSFGKEYGSFYWENPDQTAAEFTTFLEPYINPELMISGADRVSGFIYSGNSINNSIIHIVNYDYDIPSDQFSQKSNFQIKVLADTAEQWEGVYVSPDFSGQQVLTTFKEKGYVGVTIPKLDAYGILILQVNQSVPSIVSYSPQSDTTIIGGESLQLSVKAADPDGNPLYFQWSVNGVHDSSGIDTTYLFQTTQVSSGIDTIAVKVSDGSHEVTQQWLVTIQTYVFPKILFDEAHDELNTISYERAQSMDPDHPEWVYLGILKSEMDFDYITERYESGLLSASVLQDVDVLILCAPNADLSSSEMTDIVSFVSNGGGLFFLGDAGLNENINLLLQNFGIQFNHHSILETVAQGEDPGNQLICTFLDTIPLGANPQFIMNWGGSFDVSSPALALGFADTTNWRDLDYNNTKDPNDPYGPFTIVCAAEYGDGKIFCISDNALHDAFIVEETSPNDDLFLNGLKWLTKNVNQTGISDKDEVVIPYNFKLCQNYPNPFNNTTKIIFQIPIPNNISIKIYNILGHEVKSLVNKKFKAGSYFVTWNGVDNDCVNVSSGVYLYRIQSDNFVDTKKLLLLR